MMPSGPAAGELLLLLRAPAGTAPGAKARQIPHGYIIPHGYMSTVMYVNHLWYISPVMILFDVPNFFGKFSPVMTLFDAYPCLGGFDTTTAPAAAAAPPSPIVFLGRRCMRHASMSSIEPFLV